MLPFGRCGPGSGSHGAEHRRRTCRRRVACDRLDQLRAGTSRVLERASAQEPEALRVDDPRRLARQVVGSATPGRA
ncbi:hypothetical protein chiPu_0031338 [Chiloscyllium punctatum]|uniref:Uncharacterized protein n=1 Tax=Chiloscyllium punctatum TaxID=137246 RepID=A0A401TX98_CHIPU|nr:hypothetical protein [Chiloscyllium punctatum]